ncbi:MAG: redoxin domain-containing protein [Proteobacteria bacterium]|nr:redoxin domain-containing protein [Pseudomonadota bacterium]
MKRLIACAAAVTVLLGAVPASAALKPGQKAPDFSAPAAMAGKGFTFKLSDALKRGPVVLYFYPAAFTSGCTIEAHEFAEAAADFKKAGATLIGVTAGNTNRLVEFSVSECRSKFATAGVTTDVVKQYDTVLNMKPEWSDRTSYVIAPDGKIVMAYTDPNPDEHVAKTLAALKEWRAKHHR